MIRALLFAAALAVTTPAAAFDPPFPLDIDARFTLTDQTGATRTEKDFAGRTMAIFFGYAECESICSAALPAIGEAVDLLGPDGARVAAILITVDPEADTPEALAEALPRFHDDMIGLTGTPDRLAEVRGRFGVEVTELFRTPDDRPVYSHGSFIYVIGPDGRLAALLPPILPPEDLARRIAATFEAG